MRRNATLANMARYTGLCVLELQAYARKFLNTIAHELLVLRARHVRCPRWLLRPTLTSYVWRRIAVCDGLVSVLLVAHIGCGV